MNTREQDLAYALLWLRNHYDYMACTPMRMSVIAVVDRVLNDGGPITGAMGDAFRQKYISDADRKAAGVPLK